MSAVSIRNVSKKFRIPHEKKTTVFENIAGILKGEQKFEEFWALKGISFEVKRGETLGIIGENGCGKTTLLSVIANVLRPDNGKCEVTGKIAPFLGLGVGFEPELTGRENVYLYASILGLSREEVKKKYDGIVEFAELGKFMDLKLKNYSWGMHMRLAFATAMNVDPDIFLIDEVFAVGDAAFQKKCTEKMMEFKENDKTIIFVSHDLASVKKLCERTLLIVNGTINTFGPTEKVLKAYQDHISGKSRKNSLDLEGEKNA
jgi:lipopolysaccharide transport system ATP-binding protein